MFFQAKTKLWDSYCNPVETVSIGASQVFCQSQILRTRNTPTHTHPKQRQLPCPYYEASAKVLTLCIYMCCKQLIGHQNCHMFTKKNAPKKKNVEIFESQPFFSNKNQDQHLVAFDVLFQTLFHRLPSEMDG